jgi:hypothetical protein
VALLMWKLVPADALWVDAVGIVFGALVYLAVLRAMGLDPEERHVWDRIKQRVLRSRSREPGA